MEGHFGAETAGYYARFRRGYPDAIVQTVVDLVGLTRNDVVIDLGCGTGLLTRAVARHAGLVVGVDPEPDMLAAARQGGDAELASKVIWMLGSDADVPTLGGLLGDRRAGALTIGQALHFMDYERLFRQARPLLRAGGGIAVIANGTPLWQQDRDWSRSLRAALEEWFQTTLSDMCGTDRATQARYSAALTAAGYQVHEAAYKYEDDLDLERVLGGLHSALSPHDLSADRRAAFADHVARALPNGVTFSETVPVTAVIGVAG